MHVDAIFHALCSCWLAVQQCAIVPATHIYIVSDCTAAIHLFEHGGGQSVLLARRAHDLMAQLATKVIVECVLIPSHGEKSPAWQSHPIWRNLTFELEMPLLI